MSANDPSQSAAPKATRREWIGLAVIALPCLLYSMDLTVLNLALPQLTADLKPSAAQLLWIVDIYGFLIAGALITMGTLGDRIGRRKLLMIGAVAFGFASVLAAFSTTAEMLIVSRALLGLSAATLAPSTLSLIRNMFLDQAERTVAIGIWISCFSAGGAIGPLIGGVLLTYFWWGSVFLIAVPIMALLLVLTPILLPEYRDPDAGRIDLLSAALSLIAVLLVIFGIKHLAVTGLDLVSALTIAAGVLVGVVFARRQLHLPEPLIDLALFRSAAFSASLAVNIFGFFVAFGAFLLIAQYLQLVLGLSPLAAGLWTAPSSIGFIAGSMLVPRLTARWRPALVMAGGLAVAAVGFLILASAGGDSALATIMVGYIVFCLGLGPVFTLSTDLIIGTVPPERAGAAAGLAETTTELGGALGIALLGSMATAIYRTAIGSEIPVGTPGEVADVARETAGGAIAEAEALGGSLGLQLLEAARDAFAQSFQASVLLCVALALVGSLVAAFFLRRVGDTGAA
jgi:DHA2 family multidrug resistance protein-like MFS transporter